MNLVHIFLKWHWWTWWSEVVQSCIGKQRKLFCENKTKIHSTQNQTINPTITPSFLVFLNVKKIPGSLPAVFFCCSFWLAFTLAPCWHCSAWQLLAGQSGQWEWFIDSLGQMPNGDFVLVCVGETMDFCDCVINTPCEPQVLSLVWVLYICGLLMCLFSFP